MTGTNQNKPWTLEQRKSRDTIGLRAWGGAGEKCHRVPHTSCIHLAKGWIYFLVYQCDDLIYHTWTLKNNPQEEQKRTKGARCTHRHGGSIISSPSLASSLSSEESNSRSAPCHSQQRMWITWFFNNKSGILRKENESHQRCYEFWTGSCKKI